MKEFFNKNPKLIMIALTTVAIFALVIFSGRGIKCSYVTDLSNASCEITNAETYTKKENIIHRNTHDPVSSKSIVELTRTAKEKYKNKYLAFIVMAIKKGKERIIDVDDYQNITIKKFQIPTSEIIEIEHKKIASTINPNDNLGVIVYLLSGDTDITNIKTLKELKNKGGVEITQAWMGALPNFLNKQHIELFFKNKSNKEKLMLHDYFKNQVNDMQNNRNKNN